MTQANFEAVMKEIFAHEGGYADHKMDPGGATNMGITHITLAEHRGKPVTKADVKALTKAEAEAIYRKRYWNVIRGDDLPAGIDLVMMDGSVNSGVGRGPKWVQAALRVKQDGKVGPETILAARDADPVKVINDTLDARMAYLRSLKNWPTFGKGWTDRVSKVRNKAMEMAKQPSKTTPKPAEPTPSNSDLRKQDAAFTPLIALVAVVILIIAVLVISFKGG